MKTVQIPLELLLPPEEYGLVQKDRRYEDEHIKELARSIREMGQIVPIVVVKENDHYRVIDGWRRVRAFGYLAQITRSKKWRKIRAVVVKQVSDLYLFVNQTAEKWSVSTLINIIKYYQQKGHKLEQIAKAMGKSKSYVSQLMSISQFEDLQEAVDKGLDLRVAYQLSQIKNDDLRKKLIEQVKGKSRREAIAIIRNAKLKAEGLTVKPMTKPPAPTQAPEVEKAPQVAACFMCHRTFSKRDLISIRICPECQYVLNSLLKEMAERDIGWQDLLKMVKKKRARKK